MRSDTTTVISVSDIARQPALNDTLQHDGKSSTRGQIGPYRKPTAPLPPDLRLFILNFQERNYVHCARHDIFEFEGDNSVYADTELAAL